jgi:hypothetical protein
MKAYHKSTYSLGIEKRYRSILQSVYLKGKLLEFGRKRNQNRRLMGEVKFLEFTINTKQIIAAIWTLAAIVLSIVIIIGISSYYGITYSQQWMLVALFFGLLLVITLPVYLLLALWQILTKSES